MRISLKVIAILWIGLFIIIGALLFNAYSKLKPDTFIALLTEQVQKNYPGSKLDVGNISYRFSLDFNLNLQNIHLRRNDKLLASIGEVELKVPWWLLLSSQGNAQINLKNLDIFVDYEGLDIPFAGNAGSSGKANNIKLSLPSYFSDANFTLRAKQISIRDIHNARRYFAVSKLLVREFQYGKNSAFELNIPITIKHKSAQYNSELWLFGDVTPETNEWSLNYRGEFKTRENNDKFQIEDLVIGGSAKFIPSSLSVSSKLQLEIEKKNVGEGELSVDQKVLKFTLKLSKLPLNYLSFIHEEVKIPYLVNMEGEANGYLQLERQFETSLSEISGKFNFEGNLRLSDSENIPGKWQIGLQDSRWEVSFISPKGEASFFRRSAVDFKTNLVTQYVEELGFSGMDLTKVLTPAPSISEFITGTSASYFTTTISYKNCLVGEQTFDGLIKYGYTPEQKFYQADLSNHTNTFKLNFLGQGSSNVLDVKAKTFPWFGSFKFLVPLFSANAGVLDGKVEGRWSDSWETGKWLFQLSGSQLQGTEGKLPEFISRTTKFFEIDAKTFPKQQLILSGKNGVLNLNSLMLENLESVKISGLLSSQQKSFLTLSYPKNKKFKALKKEVLEPYWMQKEEP